MRVHADSGRLLALAAAGCLLTGCFATQRDLDVANVRLGEHRQVIEQQQRQMLQLEANLNAMQQRLDNALRANADNGSDLMSEKQRINQIAGRMDEVDHGLVDVKRDLVSSRGEVDSRLDELKRAIDAQANKPPPVVIPADKAAHFAAIEYARASKDATLARTLGREYVSRYPTDDKVDDVLFDLGDLELSDNHPAAALGEFNRVLKSPQNVDPRHPSNVLAETLLGMGNAYLLLHDCENAKLAFSACESRYAKDRAGQDAHGKLALIAKPTPGMCAP